MRTMLIFGVTLVAFRFLLLSIGGEEATRFLAGNAVSELELMLGATFVLVHLAAVVATPILLLAACLAYISENRTKTRGCR